MLWAGVGSAVVKDDMVLFTLEVASVVAGEFCDGLCGV